MRILQFKEVYDAILSRHGLDPLGDRVNHDTARAIVRHVNKRVREAWRFWDFPQLSHTEERAFRSIWNSDRQLRRVGENGQPDEIFFIPSMLYYRVKKSAPSDPPIGTLPTDSTYFENLSPVQTYISYEQTCRRTMGPVLGVYGSNPQLNGCDPYSLGLNFRPHEKGIYLCCSAGPTVFVHYMLPPPKFTMVPYIEGKSYQPRSRVFYTSTGECYRAIAPTTGQLPTDTTYWALEALPAMLEDFVVPAAYADCLRETWVEGEDQVRLARASLAEAEGIAALQGEVDLLLAQGQTHYYMRPYPMPCECVSQPWNGTTVTTLTDECQEDWIVWLPPSAPSGGPPPSGPSNQLYRPEIVSLRGPAQPALDAFPTVNLVTNTLIVIVIDPGSGRQEQSYQLRIGAGDLTDPGHVIPLDYNATSNNQYWERVG
jgi:hypothetical protein